MEVFPARSSLEAPSPYLEVKELAVAPIDGLGGAAGPRDPDDVDLQRGAGETGVNTKGPFPMPGGLGGEAQGSASERPGFESQLHHRPAGRLETGHLFSLSLCFLLNEMGVMTSTPESCAQS